MLLEICVSLVVLACIILMAYILAKGSGPLTCEKTVDGANACLTIRASRDIESIEVRVPDDPTEQVFRRRNLKSGESVQFVFPHTEKQITIIATAQNSVHTLKA